MTGARQTMTAWAKVIDAVELIPETYKNAFLELTGNRGALPYTLLARPRSTRAGASPARNCCVKSMIPSISCGARPAG
jgi:hypothetical protein